MLLNIWNLSESRAAFPSQRTSLEITEASWFSTLGSVAWEVWWQNNATCCLEGALPLYQLCQNHIVGSILAAEEVCMFAVTAIPGAWIAFSSDIQVYVFSTLIPWVRANYKPISYSWKRQGKKWAGILTWKLIYLNHFQLNIIVSWITFVCYRLQVFQGKTLSFQRLWKMVQIISAILV